MRYLIVTIVLVISSIGALLAGKSLSGWNRKRRREKWLAEQQASAHRSGRPRQVVPTMGEGTHQLKRITYAICGCLFLAVAGFIWAQGIPLRAVFRMPGLLLLALTAFGLLLLALVPTASRQCSDAERLNRDGTRASATILARWEQEHTAYDEEGEEETSFTYYLSFALPELGPISYQVGKGFFDSHPPSTSIEILYLPDDPFVFRPI